MAQVRVLGLEANLGVWVRFPSSAPEQNHSKTPQKNRAEEAATGTVEHCPVDKTVEILRKRRVIQRGSAFQRLIGMAADQVFCSASRTGFSQSLRIFSLGCRTGSGKLR